VKMKPKKPAWTLDDALQVIRAMQSTISEFGFHVGLGGGVLNRGQSTNDLDLYFFPLKGEDVDEAPEVGPLLAWVYMHLGRPLDEPASYDHEEYTPYRHQEKLRHFGDRRNIDIFIV